MRDAQMLQRAREKLIAMGRRIRSDFDQRTEAISESILATGDVSTVPTHLADFDAEGLEVEVAVGQTEDEMLRSIQKALQRIDEGTYGTCEDCGKPIARARLDAIPYAVRCVECEQKATEAA